MAATAFGLGTPINAPTPPLTPWGFSPYGGVTINPFLVPQFSGQSSLPLQATVVNSYTPPPVQQILQLLQIVPQQLQHLLQLEYLQQQQLQQLQQILQLIPAQLVQLQQMIQFAPQQLQQMQPAFGTAGTPILTPWGVSPQIVGAQPSYVM